ncbi:hypothetical protein B0I37DRAFT_356187 [Chaetomium sp. MPI-CAGE-AT-0009]|nr:hypothetical protein B0I37DRAFT_356187 [Chaetomium sp. MPI-CAGE-AT-0009]
MAKDSTTKAPAAAPAAAAPAAAAPAASKEKRPAAAGEEAEASKKKFKPFTAEQAKKDLERLEKEAAEMEYERARLAFALAAKYKEIREKRAESAQYISMEAARERVRRNLGDVVVGTSMTPTMRPRVTDSHQDEDMIRQRHISYRTPLL